MTTLKGFSFNFSDLAFMRDQIRFRPLFDADGKAIVNWSGVGPIYDAAGSLIWDGVGMTASEAVSAFGVSFNTYTSSQGLRNIDGLANNLFNPEWGNTDLPFMQRTRVIFDKYLKPLDASDPNAFYAAKFAVAPNPPLADYTKTAENLTEANVTDYTPRMISRTVTTAGVTFETQPGSTHLVKDANGYTAVSDYGMLQSLGQQDARPSVSEDGSANNEWFIGGTNPGVAPVNGWFVLFGQFFDHGLDFVGKGADGTKITITLSPDDPMYGVIDPTSGRPATKIVISRADVSGFAEDGTAQWVNHASPYIDQSQTYGSHAAVTELLREWIMDPVSGSWKPGMAMLDGATSAAWTNAWGEITSATLPTLNELRAHLLSTGRDDLAWEDVLNLRQRGADGDVVDSDASTDGVQGTGTGAALLLDMNPRFDAAHFANALNPDSGAAFDANILTLATAAQDLGCSFGYDENAGTIYLDIPAGMMGPGSAATQFTGASALYFWVNFGDFSIKNTMALGPTILPVNESVHDAVSDLLLAAVGDHYIAGDGRANENIGLTAVHHVFHEEHNYQVRNIIEAIKAQDAREVALDEAGTYAHDVLHDWQVNTGEQDASGNYIHAGGAIAWDHEKIFQAAKMTVEMEYQHTAVDQFARTITPNLHEFVGYNSGENATISLDFSQVAYRFGHSTLRESIDVLDPTGSLSGAVMRIALEKAFLSPEKFAELGAGAIAMGMTHQQANEVDEFLTPALNQGLLGQPLDLAAINIARGRDLGIPTLNDMREALQLTRYASWADFGANVIHPDNLVNFIAAYSFDGDVARASAILALASNEMSTGDASNVWGYTVEQAINFLNNSDGALFGVDGFEKIDCWLGGLAEIHVTGGLLGETFDTIFVDQIGRLMDGDRFYYLQRLSNINYGQEIIDEQFKDIIERTTGARHLNGSAFAYADQYLDLAADANADADIAAATAALETAQLGYDNAVTVADAADAVLATSSADVAAAEAAALSDAGALRSVADVARAGADAISTTSAINALLAALVAASATDATALQTAAGVARGVADNTDATALQSAATQAEADDQAFLDAQAASDAAAALVAIALVARDDAQANLDALVGSGAPQEQIDAAQVELQARQTAFDSALADAVVATDAAILAQSVADATDFGLLQQAADAAMVDDQAATVAQGAAVAAIAADVALTTALNAYVAVAAADQAAEAAAAAADFDADAAEQADVMLTAAQASVAIAATTAASAAAAEAAAADVLAVAQANLTRLQTEGNAGTEHQYGSLLLANPTMGIYSDAGTTMSLNGDIVTVLGKQYIRDVRTPSAATSAGDSAGYALDGAPNSGGESHEVIVASDRDDLIYARGGDDTVYGEDGKDLINGGNGIDRLYGGDGDDTILGGDGGDLIDGGLGDDVLFGEQNATAAAGIDQVIGSDGNDYIDGGIGIDKLSGSAGDDVIFGGGDTDAFTHGGDGNDYIDGGVTGDLLWGDGGSDLIVGRADQDIVAGMDGDDILRPGPLSQSLTGGGDEVMGGDGLTDRGENGKGTGFDIIDLSDWQAAPIGANVNFATQQNPMQAIDGNPQFPAWVGVEGAIGSRNDDTFLGDAGSNWLIGGSGNDKMTGGIGNDLIIGDGVRLDTLIGTYNSGYDGFFDGASHRATGFAEKNGLLDAVGWGDQKHFTEILKSSMFRDLVLGGSEVTQIWRNGVAQSTGESAGVFGDGGIVGEADVVNFSGVVGDYTVELLHFDAATRQLVASSSATTVLAVRITDEVADRDGQDIVVGVESFRFSDGNGGHKTFSASQLVPVPASGAAIISDLTPLEGQALTVDTSTITDPNGVGTLQYQWQRSTNGTTWTDIGGANDSSYTPQDLPLTLSGADAGAQLRVVVSFIDVLGTQEVITSAPTGPVGINWEVLIGSTFNGLAGNDFAVGSNLPVLASDTLRGNAGDDSLWGRAGTDILVGGAGNDDLHGGTGTDRADYAGAITNFRFTSDGTTLTIIDTTGAEGTDTAENVENIRFNNINYRVVTGTAGHDTALNGVLGTNDSQLVIGRDGWDTMHGGDGSDILLGGDGSDNVMGGAGDDYIIQYAADVGFDRIDGGAGTNDTYVLHGTDAAETFRIYTRAEAEALGIAIVNASSTIIVTRNGTTTASKIAELRNIEEIVINTANTTVNDGNGVVNGGPAGGDTIEVIGNFVGSGLSYSTITIAGSSANDTVDITGLTSDHRIVFDSNGGTDTLVGAVRPQDVFNGDNLNDQRLTATTAAATDVTSAFGSVDGLNALMGVGARAQLRELGFFAPVTEGLGRGLSPLVERLSLDSDFELTQFVLQMKSDIPEPLVRPTADMAEDFTPFHFVDAIAPIRINDGQFAEADHRALASHVDFFAY